MKKDSVKAARERYTGGTAVPPTPVPLTPVPPTPPPAAATRLDRGGSGTRRAIYGLNVAVACVAAVALGVLVNFLAIWGFSRLPAGVRDHLRYDQSAQRWYSLSDRSRAMLAGLDERYRIVTLFHDAGDAASRSEGGRAAEAERRDRVRDFISLYARSANVTVEHLDPLTPGEAVPTVYREVAARYEARLSPLVDRVTASLEMLSGMEAAFQEAADELEAAAGGAAGEAVTQTGMDGEAQELRRVRQVAEVLARNAEQMKASTATLRDMLLGPLPAYGEVKLRLSNYLAALTASTQSSADALDAAIARRLAPPAAMNTMERVRQRLLREGQGARDVLRDLELVESSPEYEAVRQPLTRGDAVVLLGPGRVRVLRYAELFARGDAEGGADGGAGEVGGEEAAASDPEPVGSFIGEQRLTGALATFALDRPPLVVLVHHYSDPRIEGMFAYLEGRLRLLDMDVRRVNLVGRRTASGEQAPPDPLPSPESGQAAVWVIAPIFQSGGGDGGGGGAAAVRQAVAELLERRMARGEGAVLFLDYDPAAQFGQRDPLLDIAARIGITTRLNELVLWEQSLPGGSTRPHTDFEIHQWPQASAITRGLGSTPGRVFRATPLVLKKELDAFAIVTLRRPRMWLEADPRAGETAYDPSKAIDEAIVAAGGEERNSRFAVFTDPFFAADVSTAAGLAESAGGLAGAGSAGSPEAAAEPKLRYPANAELMIHTIAWASHLDDLISTAPRSGDVPRVEPIPPATLTATRAILLIGLPLLIAGAGGIVWWRRRRE